MTTLFVPYQGDRPASLIVNGHKVVVVCPEEEIAYQWLEEVGADKVCEVQVESVGEQEQVFGHLVASVRGGVVVVPTGVDFDEIMSELEAQLPWVQ